MTKNALLSILVFSLLLAACATSAPSTATLPAPELSLQESTATPPATPTIEIITLTDALGRDVVIAGKPGRIISLSASITETLFAIGAAEQLVARDNLSVFPEAAEQLIDLGDYFVDFNAESYIALAPNLVLVNEKFPVEGIFGLEALDIPVFVLATPSDLDSLFSNISLLGSLTGNQDSADLFIEELDGRLAAIDLSLQDLQDDEVRPTVFYELEASDPNAPWTYGSGTLLDEIVQLSGGQNTANALSGAWVQYALSDLLSADPQIILLGDAAFGITAESLSAREGWSTLSAVQTGQIYPFDDSLISNPGPRIVDVIEELAALFHPILFE